MVGKMERLLNGETFQTKEKGNSMTPVLKSNQEHTLAPVKLQDVKIGDIVYCKVKGRFYTHLVKAVDAQKGCLIGNNHSGINGWTKKVFGKVVNF